MGAGSTSPLPPVETRPGGQTRLHCDANIEVALAQSARNLNDPECAHFALSHGVWVFCVSVPGCLLGSCANCHYNNEGNRCSLCKYYFQLVFASSVVTVCRLGGYHCLRRCRY